MESPFLTNIEGGISLQLTYKPDFQEAEQRLEAWWESGIIDRVCLQAKVQKRKVSISGYEDADDHSMLKKRWMDAKYQIYRALEIMEATEYIGEAFPVFVPNLGPDLWSTLYGTDLKFSETTSWAKHYVDDWEKFSSAGENYIPNFDNEYWQTIVKMTDIALEKGEGRFITGLPDLHPGGDLMVSLSGPENLCFALIEKPELIKHINMQFASYYTKVYDQLYEKISSNGLGSTTWLNAYHNGRFYVPSCDFAALISPEMFNDIFLPGLMAEIEFLDRSIFHLDGPGALKHLDTLLAIDKLDGIQWVYGAGNGPSTKWVEVYKKIQKAGKCTQICVEDVHEIRELLDVLSPEGLLFTFAGVLSETQAEEAIASTYNF